MATRSGSVDPGALVYLLRERLLSLAELDRALEHESGVLGLAGRDVREAVAAEDEDARLAVAVLCHRVAAAVGAMAAAAGGLDALVFTAGIGENSPRVRELVCARLRFLGVELDADANESATPDAQLGERVWVVRAREELVAARAARSVLAAGRNA
jgi:acetate kinase